MITYQEFWDLCESVCEPANVTGVLWLDLPNGKSFLLSRINGRFENRSQCYLKYQRTYKAAGKEAGNYA